MVLLKFFRTFPPVEAHTVTQLFPPGKSIQGLRYSYRIRQGIYADTGKKTINLFNPVELDVHVLQLGKVWYTDELSLTHWVKERIQNLLT